MKWEGGRGGKTERREWVRLCEEGEGEINWSIEREENTERERVGERMKKGGKRQGRRRRRGRVVKARR